LAFGKLHDFGIPIDTDKRLFRRSAPEKDDPRRLVFGFYSFLKHLTQKTQGGCQIFLD